MKSTTVLPIETRTFQPNGHLENIDRLMRSNGRQDDHDAATAIYVRRHLLHRLPRR